MKSAVHHAESAALYADRARFLPLLGELPSNSLQAIIVEASALGPPGSQRCAAAIQTCARAVRPGGLLFVAGQPAELPAIGVALDQVLTFKYWIAVETAPRVRPHGLPAAHVGVLLFSKPGGRAPLRRARAPHEWCAACGRPRRDWGGRAHLMHPDGCALSDVWTHLAPTEPHTLAPALSAWLLRLVEPPATSHGDHQRPWAVVGPLDLADVPSGQAVAESRCAAPAAPAAVPPALLDTVHHSDALAMLRRLPDGCVDMAFADPPYNLDKAYRAYTDRWQRERYLAWCNAWLAEYARVLKPTGSLFVLNLPRWALYHATFLSQRLHLQSWIVWREMSEPRGKLLPAHYALLHCTKHPTRFTFAYGDVSPIDARCYCRRAACIRQRKARGDDAKEPLTDLWWDIHRVRHRRDRDDHPCQLPDALLERIIRLATRPGDVVLDALCGTGTSAVAAARLGRHYIAADVDEQYVRIAREKLAALARYGCVPRVSTARPRPPYTKKQLQLELRALASRLGRLPSPEEARQLGVADPQVVLALFPTWGKALRAAKIALQQSGAE
jgi:site-specific DNA-methyltransferase (adenine-specific)